MWATVYRVPGEQEKRISIHMPCDALWWSQKGQHALEVIPPARQSLAQTMVHMTHAPHQKPPKPHRFPLTSPIQTMFSSMRSPLLRRIFPAMHNVKITPWMTVSCASWLETPPVIDDMVVDAWIRWLYGRWITTTELVSFAQQAGLPQTMRWEEIVQWGILRGEVIWQAGMHVHTKPMFFTNKKKRTYTCARCHSREAQMHFTTCPYCQCVCPYCEACMTMGRIRACTLLLTGNRPPIQQKPCNKPPPQPHIDVHTGQLGIAQRAPVAQALQFLRTPTAGNAFLLWAVTGAGKTEMVFPLIAEVISQGGCVLLASPRRDVVLELLPRVRQAFASQYICALYGGSPDRAMALQEITLATTHQILRFRHAFDLVIVDEIDAFPYHGNAMLHVATQRACKKEGKSIWLSATPPYTLQRQAKRGTLPYALVCMRYHGHPLPVPQWHALAPLASWTRTTTQRNAHTPPRLPSSLEKIVRKSVTRDAQLFVFVPRIADIPVVTLLFQHAFPQISIAGTSSQDVERATKVAQFRQKEICILVTTTILERGVTVPKTDVCILDAHVALFDETTLIQMAGRAGRKIEDPRGNVYFFAPYRTAPQRAAIAHIVEMNTQAKRRYPAQFHAHPADNIP